MIHTLYGTLALSFLLRWLHQICTRPCQVDPRDRTLWRIAILLHSDCTHGSDNNLETQSYHHLVFIYSVCVCNDEAGFGVPLFFSYKILTIFSIYICPFSKSYHKILKCYKMNISPKSSSVFFVAAYILPGLSVNAESRNGMDDSLPYTLELDAYTNFTFCKMNV